MGPLSGVRIVEFAGLGPGPMAAMLLADLGASVIQIVRPDADMDALDRDPVMRNRATVPLDLKKPHDALHAQRLVDRAEALIEGFRPGVMEGLGLGPDVCRARNTRLVYVRMTGWGQSGPLADRAGHDINYIALTGALDRIGRAGAPPTIPLNLIGDYGGGALYLALGLLSGVIEARASGRGQTVDVAMVDGVASLLAKQYGLLAAGLVRPGRAQNLLDGGAPFYDVYPCSDGRHVAVGAIEEKFYRELLKGLGLDAASLPPQHDMDGWPALRRIFAERFALRSRDEWAAIFADTDACVSPVLAMDEAPSHPSAQSRDAFVTLNGVRQPGPAPRFSRTPADAPARSRRMTPDEAIASWARDAPG
jgi:crotonobetainyl-CoA:carnitine CoA-transferase CaiB-like acyl-CoA transferase